MNVDNVHTVRDAIGLAYLSYNEAKPLIGSGPDRQIRHPEWTRKLLNRLGNPDTHGYNIAVTGSKGKGSHSILLAAILEKCGFKTGLFTGPHLVDFMERFRVDGQTISEPQFMSYMKTVYQESARLPVPTGQYFGPVGLLAAVASLWFRDESTDVNVFELGRGALHDDVNQIRHQGAVITPIFLEHVRELGPTLLDIAVEKSGVIAGARWVSCAPQGPQVSAQLALQSQQSNAKLRVLGEQFDYRRESQGNNELVELTYPEGRYVIQLPESELSTPVNPMLAENAAVAFDAARQVMLELRPEERIPGLLDLSRLVLPGRLQVLRDSPLIAVDGTIHAQSARYIKDWAQGLKRSGRVRQLGLVVGIPADKDGAGVLKVLSEAADWVILTRAHNPHLNFDSELAQTASEYFPLVRQEDYLEEAVKTAHESITAEDGLLLLGTQSFVGDALRIFDYPTRSIWRHSPTWEGVQS